MEMGDNEIQNYRIFIIKYIDNKIYYKLIAAYFISLKQLAC